MPKFNRAKKSKAGKKKSLAAGMKTRRNARAKPVLPRKGVTQTTYETGFFDFFEVFWKNNEGMELRNLTRQVSKAWEALLPKPKLSKKRVLKDYAKEFKALQEEMQRQQKEQEEDDTGTEMEASSRSNFDSEESVSTTQSKSDVYENDSASEQSSKSQNDSGNEYESDQEEKVKTRTTKRKRKGRKYITYDTYLKRNKKFKSNANEEKEKGSEGKVNSKSNNSNSSNETINSKKEEDSESQAKDGVFFPIREETSFDRIVKNEYDDQNEMLRKLKLRNSNIEPTTPDNDKTRSVDSINTLSSHLGDPQVPQQGSSIQPSPKLSSPTDTLHVKNLVVGIKQPELQEIFKVFLKDIVLIRVLDNKLNGEAVVEFKNVEAAEKVWSQMNGVEYKRLPLVLEFANKEDLLY